MGRVRTVLLIRPVIRIRRRVKMKMGIRRRVEVESAARTVLRAAGASSSRQDPSPLHEASKSRPSLGVRKRGEGGFHLEVRTRSRGCPKIHVAHFGQDRELAEMAHDVARRCHLGEVAYLALHENKLNYWKKRVFLAAQFRGDGRMMELADAHRRKDEAGQNWDTDMKTRLRELASDALKLIKATAQEEAAAPQQSAGIDRQNINGTLNFSGFSDDGPPFDIDGALGPEDGAAPENWPHTKQSLRSITPELPEFSLEDQVEMLWRDNLRLEAENKKLEAVWGENARLEAEIRTLKARLTGQRFPEGHQLQSSGDYQAATNIVPRDLSPDFAIDALNCIGEGNHSEHQPNIIM